MASHFGVAAPPPPPVSMVAAGEGMSVWALGVLVTIKALANETGGSYSFFEDVVPPGAGPPAHFHTKEVETWYILEGELIWTVGGNDYHAKKGSFIHLPKFVPHTFANKFDKPARMALTYAPGGFEEWFLQVGKPVSDPDGPPPPTTKEDVQKAIELGKGYGINFILQHDTKVEDVQEPLLSAI